MNHAEINQFIASYLLNDKTNSSLMISAPWGTGKSYYITNTLIPYIEETTDFKCLVVSVYGVTSLRELSDFVYRKNTKKTLSNAIKTIQSNLAQSKVSEKAALGFNGISLAPAERVGLTFADLDLTDRLLILEDIERSSIDVVELLGYVNNLTEYSHAKVVLVANEEKLIIYETKTDGKKQNKVLTEPSKRYVKTKEKTIRDTIKYQPGVIDVLSSIYGQFINTSISKFVGDSEEFAGTIDADVLEDIEEQNPDIGLNLRSIIFGIDKTREILDRVSFDVKKEFFNELLLGNIAFSLKWKNDSSIANWTNDNATLLGCRKHALLKPSRDYIVEQKFCSDDFEKEQERFFERIEQLQKNDKLREVLNVLYNYYEEQESLVVESIQSLTKMVKGGDVPKLEYSKIGNYLISVKESIGCHDKLIDECLDEMVNSVKDVGKEFVDSVTFHSGIQLESSEAKTEFKKFKERMLEKRDNMDVVSFDYNRTNLTKWLNYVRTKSGTFSSERGFAKFLDVAKFIELLKTLTAAEIADVRHAFHDVYSFANLYDYFTEDVNSLDALKEGLKALKEFPSYDAIQKLQIKYFISNVEEIINTIRNDRDA